ncbi:MAG: hypothetical protein RLZ56_804 [Bacteroidota bacterium]|jgi:hypothetical protein
MLKNEEITARMGKSIIIVLLCFCIGIQLNAQTNHSEESWWDYLNQNRYTEHWGSWIDLQSKRKENYVDVINANEYTLGASYFQNTRFKYTAALTYVDNYMGTGNTYHIGEYRPWQQIQLSTSARKSKWVQWIRLEERFKETAINNAPSGRFDFNYRLRYFILGQFPMFGHAYDKGSISFVSSEELYLNFGKNIVYNTFDQNRFFLGIYYYLNKENILQLGYTNMFQKYNLPNKYLNADVLRISLFNNIDFRRH